MKTIAVWLSVLVLGFFGLGAMAFEPVVIDLGNSGKVGAGIQSLPPAKHGLMSTGARTKFVDLRTFAYLGYLKYELAFPEVSVRILTNIDTGEFASHVILKDTLETDYLMAPTEVSSGNTTVIFGVRGECEEGFYPSDLVFTLFSNDSDSLGSNRFGKVEYYNRSNYIYSGTSFAQVNGGPLITSGEWKSTKVNRFIFIGSLSKTANANTQADRDSIRRWMWSYPNFSITGTWSLVEGGKTIASSSHTLSLLTPPELKLGLHRNAQNGQYVLLEVSGDYGRDLLVEFSPTVNGPWRRIMMGTGGGRWSMPVTGELGSSGIFRASSLKPFGY